MRKKQFYLSPLTIVEVVITEGAFCSSVINPQTLSGGKITANPQDYEEDTISFSWDE